MPDCSHARALADIGYGDLGSFGNPTSETPALDTMAVDGAKLVQYYSAACICSPSRGALMTGRTFGRIGVYPGVFSPNSVGGLPLNETTVAERLKTVGYVTGMCGKVGASPCDATPTPIPAALRPLSLKLCRVGCMGTTQWHLGTNEYLPMHRGFDTYFGAPMTQNECYSNIIAPGSTRKGGSFGPCPQFNGSSALPWKQSSGIFPDDPDAVDMVNVDEAYDTDAANVVKRAHAAGDPFFYYFASHHTHAPQFAACQSACDERGDDCLSNCTSRRGLFGDSLGLLDRSVGRMHALLEELEISNNTLTIYSAE